MKITKRLIPIVLSLVFVISAFMTVSALAAPSGTAEQDGIVATLTCDKIEYSANEKVAVTLNVKNNNPYSVEGIETEIILPDGIKTESGELKQTAFTLNAGENKDGSVTLAKIPEKPIASNSPQTGDNSLVGLYAVIMLLSGGAMVVIGIKEKWFRKKGVMSLILCFAMVGTVLSPLAVNAAGTSKNFSVENTIKYGGKNVTIKANISYLYEKHNKVTFNGTDTYYAVGDTVEITAPEPEEGKHFDHWTAVKGDVTFADPNKSSTTFVMPDGEVELKANYAPNTYTITVTSGDNGAISPAGEVNVEYGQNQTFTITPNTGYHIVDVEVDGVCKGAITSYTFENVKETHTIKAVFAIDTFAITASVNDSSMGTITETANVNYDGSKTFTITPNTGYHIVDVEVDGVSKGAITSYTFENVKETHTIKAVFAIDTFAITASVNDSSMGTITETANVNYDGSKTFTIAANTGYHIVDVEVDGVSKGAKTSYTFNNVKEVHTIRAVFAIDTFTITASVNDSSMGTITETANVNYDGSKTFTIAANTGYHIVDVEVDGVCKGAIASYTFENVNETHTIKATFAIDTFAITASVNNSIMGTITETANVNYGDSKTFTIAANTGYHIVDVEVDGVSKGAKTSYTFNNVKEVHTIRAVFAIDTFTITASVNDSSMGTITETANVNYDGSKTFTIAANTGYHIVDVEVDGVSKGAITSYTFENVNETHTIKATFAINPYSITATAGANGTITESARLNTGDSKTFTFYPNTGYSVYDVQVDGNSIGAVSSYTFENVRENHTISVTYKKHKKVSTMLELNEAINSATDVVALAGDIDCSATKTRLRRDLFIDCAGHTITNDGDPKRLELHEGTLTVYNGKLTYLPVYGSSNVKISDSLIDTINLSQNSSLDFSSGEINVICVDSAATSVNLNISGGVLKRLVVFGQGSLNITGGSFYFDPTSYLDTDKYKATKTKDADNVDIWVVTEK